MFELDCSADLATVCFRIGDGTEVDIKVFGKIEE